MGGSRRIVEIVSKGRKRMEMVQGERIGDGLVRLTADFLAKRWGREEVMASRGLIQFLWRFLYQNEALCLEFLKLHPSNWKF
jgi:hypothetical protein